MMASDEVRALATQICETMRAYADAGFSTFAIDPIEIRGSRFTLSPREWRAGPGRREEGLLFRLEAPPPSPSPLSLWTLVEPRASKPYICSYLERDVDTLDRDRKHLTSSYVETKGAYFFLQANAKTEVHLDKRAHFLMTCSDAGFTTIQRDYVVFIYEQNFRDRPFDLNTLRSLLSSYVTYSLIKAHFQADRGVVIPGL
jgi:hypothetical protein